MPLGGAMLSKAAHRESPKDAWYAGGAAKLSSSLPAPFSAIEAATGSGARRPHATCSSLPDVFNICAKDKLLSEHELARLPSEEGSTAEVEGITESLRGVEPGDGKRTE